MGHRYGLLPFRLMRAIREVTTRSYKYFNLKFVWLYFERKGSKYYYRDRLASASFIKLTGIMLSRLLQLPENKCLTVCQSVRQTLFRPWFGTLYFTSGTWNETIDWDWRWFWFIRFVILNLGISCFIFDTSNNITDGGHILLHPIFSISTILSMFQNIFICAFLFAR